METARVQSQGKTRKIIRTVGVKFNCGRIYPTGVGFGETTLMVAASVMSAVSSSASGFSAAAARETMCKKTKDNNAAGEVLSVI